MRDDFLHDTVVQAPAFYHFVISSLINEVKPLKVDVFYKTNKFETDACLPDGFLSYTSGPTIIEIKYSNDFSCAFDTIRRIKKYTDLPVCVIGAWKEKYYKIDNCHIFGLDLIKYFAKKYPELWWCFCSSYDESAEVKISSNGKKAILHCHRLLNDIPCELPINEIDRISKANANEFVRLSRINKTAIIAGNGISIPFGSDRWETLANNVFDYLSPYYIDNPENIKKVVGKSTYSLTSLTKCTIQKKKFDSAIKDGIYRKYDIQSMHNEYTLLHSIVKGKIKHKDMIIATYNYDCFLENDFKIFYPHVSIRPIFNNRKVAITNELKIIHLHGYIPRTSRGSKNIVLTDEEYFKAYKGKNKFAPFIQSILLEKYVCLFVGSSMSDMYQMSLIDDARQKVLKNNDEFNHKTWKCFALMCFGGLSPKDKLTLINYYLRKGIFVIFANDYTELPGTLDKLMAF